MNLSIAKLYARIATLPDEKIPALLDALKTKEKAFNITLEDPKTLMTIAKALHQELRHTSESKARLSFEYSPMMATRVLNSPQNLPEHRMVQKEEFLERVQDKVQHIKQTPVTSETDKAALRQTLDEFRSKVGLGSSSGGST
ncbi:MAG: hypothetical protein KIT27_07675 [Legionellales bacterium]|nr:hypothetical protein [Legionellales bacterium]